MEDYNEELSEVKERKERELRYIKDTPLFSMLEFNLTNFCNRNCDFCPVTSKNANEQVELGIDLYVSVLRQLSNIEYDGILIFSGFSEPLLHSNILSLVENKNKHVPNSTLIINTNGDILDKHISKYLLENGVDYISISIYDGPGSYENFLNLKSVVRINKRIVLRKRYENFNINNRNGSLYINSDVPLHQMCYYPFYFIFIDYDGEVLPCPHDFLRKNSVGNVNSDHLIDLWLEGFYHIRNTLLHQNRPHGCYYCDVDGRNFGRNSFEEHKKIRDIEGIKEN